jgi:hypothetical protein
MKQPAEFYQTFARAIHKELSNLSILKRIRAKWPTIYEAKQVTGVESMGIEMDMRHDVEPKKLVILVYRSKEFPEDACWFFARIEGNKDRPRGQARVAYLMGDGRFKFYWDTNPAHEVLLTESDFPNRISTPYFFALGLKPRPMAVAFTHMIEKALTHCLEPFFDNQARGAAPVCQKCPRQLACLEATQMN